MPNVHDRALSRRELARRMSRLDAVAGVRLVTLGDGAERGVRVLEFRTGSGFDFDVMVDRCMDVGAVRYRGASIGWQSPTGFRSPWLHDPEGERGLGFLRSFTGFMNTCGLDHAFFMESLPADRYGYPAREAVDHPLHGRAPFTPARLVGYGARWEGDDCVLWAEGEVVQAAMFGEDLHLVRRIEAWVGGCGFTVEDRVENRGFSRTPHMLLYHVNLGWPLLDEGSEFRAPVERVMWRSHAAYRNGVGYRTMPAPQPADFVEQVYTHEVAAEPDGTVPAALVNRRLDLGGAGGPGLAFLIEYDRKAFPVLLEWQCVREGGYVLGIEPSTAHPGGAALNEEHGLLRHLDHGDPCRYRTRFSAVAGASAIADLEARIDAARPQLAGEFPEASGIGQNPPVQGIETTGESP